MAARTGWLMFVGPFDGWGGGGVARGEGAGKGDGVAPGDGIGVGTGVRDGAAS